MAQSNRPPRFANDRLFVDESFGDDSCVLVSVATMGRLGLFPGDIVLMSGRKLRDTYCIVLAGQGLGTRKICMNKHIRVGLRAKPGDPIRVQLARDVPEAAVLHVLPFEDSARSVPGHLLESSLRSYFTETYRPMRPGDTFLACSVEFKVVRIDPPNDYGSCCLVTPKTAIRCELGQYATREDEEQLDCIGYEDIGGVGDALKRLRFLIEPPLQLPCVFARMNVRPPTMILLYGPAGLGKTYIAQAIANETRACFVHVKGVEIMSKEEDEALAELSRACQMAEKNAPSIVFLDDLHFFTPHRAHEDEKRQGLMWHLLDSLSQLRKKVGRQAVVIGATQIRPQELHPALTRSGRFDYTIELRPPDEAGRLEILAIHTSNMKLCEDVELSQIARMTQGFVGADLAQLCHDAARHYLRELFASADFDEASLDSGQLCIARRYFEQALAHLRPIHGSFNNYSSASWEDIGGLEDVKRHLKSVVEVNNTCCKKKDRGKCDHTLIYSRGCLLFGPPRCGKSLLASAIASEMKASLVSIKGSEVLKRKSVQKSGEVETLLRKTFEQAQALAPCVLLLSELDLLMKAGKAVCCQLLTLLDNMAPSKLVFVVVTTDRLERLALKEIAARLEGGCIYVGLPAFEARVDIFKICMRDVRVEPEMDWEYLADRSEGFVGADIAAVCQSVKQMAMRAEVKEKLDKEAEEEERRKQATEAEELRQWEEMDKKQRAAATEEERGGEAQTMSGDQEQQSTTIHICAAEKQGTGIADEERKRQGADIVLEGGGHARPLQVVSPGVLITKKMFLSALPRSHHGCREDLERYLAYKRQLERGLGVEEESSPPSMPPPTMDPQNDDDLYD